MPIADATNFTQYFKILLSLFAILDDCAWLRGDSIKCRGVELKNCAHSEEALQGLDDTVLHSKRDYIVNESPKGCLDGNQYEHKGRKSKNIPHSKTGLHLEHVDQDSEHVLLLLRIRAVHAVESLPALLPSLCAGDSQGIAGSWYSGRWSGKGKLFL